MTLGAMIYQLRTQKNMSQGDLADALDVSRQSISKWENDNSVPELDKLIKLSQVFNVTLDALVNGEPQPTPQAVPCPVIQKSPTPGHQLAGIILLIAAAIVFATMSIIGFLSGTPLLGLGLSLPLVFNGILCLLCKTNTGFFCCWLNYGIAWSFQFVFTFRAASETTTVIPLLFLVFALALTTWSLYKLWKGHFSCKRAGKILWSVIVAGCLLLQIHFTGVCLSSTTTRHVVEESEAASVSLLPEWN